ncbi:MAG: hypothetical protein E7616_01860 [Ruminococcaceae bacterium]|nr:hypothetical protein [Oscillospiraceae bacterium]
MSKTKKTKTDYLRYVAAAILVVSLIASALLLLSYWEKQQGIFPLDDDADIGLNNTIRYNGKEYVLRDDVETLLILGLDKFSENVDDGSYNNDRQADFIMLFVIDKEKGSTSAIHLNRDTMAQMDILGIGGQKVGTSTAQLALAHTYGSGKNDSCRNMSRAVSRVLGGVPIDHYISLTMDSAAIINDLVGGVTVEVLHDFSDVDPELVKGQTVTLHGEQALRYVRGRENVEEQSNVQRMERQRQYLTALREQIKLYMKNDPEFSAEMVLELSDHMVSNYAIDVMDDVAKELMKHNITQIHTIDGELKTGEAHMEFYPDDTAIRQLVVDLFYELK